MLHASCFMLHASCVKIVSYNVRHCVDIDGVRSEKATADVIAAQRANFVALQEMDEKTARVQGVDQPKELGRLTQMHAEFAKAIPLRGGAYGNALLSQETPIAVKRLPLPGKEPRVLLLAEFADCFVGSMHLDLGKKQRHAAVSIVREAVEKAAAVKPVFICGDWNDPPDSETLKQIGQFMKVISTVKTHTFHGSSKNPVEQSHQRCVIDYIAVDSAHAAKVEVIASAVTEDRHTSDHAPISVTLKMKNEE